MILELMISQSLKTSFALVRAVSNTIWPQG